METMINILLREFPNSEVTISRPKVDDHERITRVAVTLRNDSDKMIYQTRREISPFLFRSTAPEGSGRIYSHVAREVVEEFRSFLERELVTKG
jgi:hypothetical protein